MPETTFELGSNLAGGIGFVGMEQFKANVQRIYADISGPVLRAALEAGAEVFRSAIAAATPVGVSYRRRWTKRSRYGEEKMVTERHAAGTAKKSVITYQRQRGIMVTAEGASYLVGYEKKRAYYMYWYEYGRGPGAKGRGIQPPRPFMRAAYAAAEPAALEAATRIIAARIERG